MKEQGIEVDTKRERIKKHFRDNRKNYITGIAAFAAGIVIAKVTHKCKPFAIQSHIHALIAQNQVGKKIVNNTVQTISMYGNVIGRPGHPVVDTTTGHRFESIKLAAEAMGVEYNAFRNRLNDGLDVHGHQFIRLIEDV